MINIGWSLISAEVGMLGQPARYCNLTFAENEADSPWESFAVEHGFKPEDSTVTVNETMSYNRLGPGGGMSSQTTEQSLETLARMIQGSVGIMTRLQFAKGCRYHLALNPTLARQLSEAGFTKQSLAKWLYENTCIKWEHLSQQEKNMIKAAVKYGMAPGVTLDDCKKGQIFPAFADPKYLAALVAGDAAGNTVLWNSPVGSTSINPDMAKSVKGTQSAFMTKRIRGATLTKAGR